jgi:hypothetical protein
VFLLRFCVVGDSADEFSIGGGFFVGFGHLRTYVALMGRLHGFIIVMWTHGRYCGLLTSLSNLHT